MPNILTLTGSPIKNGSTDILLGKIAEGIRESFPDEVKNEFVRLNDYQYLACQSCGKNPEPDFCFFHDEIYPIYSLLMDCDIVLFGSPVYYDTVSAQAKLFIDRCNCFRPVDFKNPKGPVFRKILTDEKLGAIALVGGERQDLECARKVLAGFYKWLGISNCGMVSYSGSSWEQGAVEGDLAKLNEAVSLGRKIASRILPHTK
jgi:multimeric flavodoxin WrbA